MAQESTYYMSPEKGRQFFDTMRKREQIYDNRVRQAFRAILGRDPTEEDMANPEVMGRVQGMVGRAEDKSREVMRKAEARERFGIGGRPTYA